MTDRYGVIIGGVGSGARNLVVAVILTSWALGSREV